MITNLDKNDIDEVMNIWLNSNKKTHYYINEKFYLDNFNDVKESILKANTYVFKKNNEIVGFIGLIDDYIAGIFVKENYQRMGIGHNLINKVKSIHNNLILNVYIKNQTAIDFYKKEGFTVKQISIDEDNNEEEYVMYWKR